MNSGALFLCASLLSVSFLVLLLQRQIAAGTLERNSGMGLRTKATKTSDAAWTTGHLAAAPALLTSAVTGGVAGLVGGTWAATLLASSSSSPAALIVAGCGYVAFLGLLSFATAKADRAARSVA